MKSFETGYQWGNSGKPELSTAQIETMFPKLDSTAFYQGFLDGREGDKFRLKLGRDMEWRNP